MLNGSFFEKLLLGLPSIRKQHARTNPVYQLFVDNVRQEVEKNFGSSSLEEKSFGPFGQIVFPYFKMGNRDSLDLFDLDEMILFSFYWANRDKYRRVLDIGANIGLHSMLLAKSGYEIESFEPDPIHFHQLESVLTWNHLKKVNPHCAAVSSRQGQAEFVRVLGNTTSSHLAGSKIPYGQLDRFMVPVVGIDQIIKPVDLVKMDVEGHEAEILLATKAEHWLHTDALVEVGSAEKALAIFNHLKTQGVNLFAQKIGWEQVNRFEDMPIGYKEGTLFISKKTQMPWG